jgi:hypothetical protein
MTAFAALFSKAFGVGASVLRKKDTLCGTSLILEE